MKWMKWFKKKKIIVLLVIASIASFIFSLSYAHHMGTSTPWWATALSWVIALIALEGIDNQLADAFLEYKKIVQQSNDIKNENIPIEERLRLTQERLSNAMLFMYLYLGSILFFMVLWYLGVSTVPTEIIFMALFGAFLITGSLHYYIKNKRN